MAATADERKHNIFVNCPFDPDFKPLFDAIIFTAALCGLKVRSALEISDSGELRFQKIVRLIGESGFSIHDISRTELDPVHRLPRFNMPIELGMALGMKYHGTPKLRTHALLVLDTEKYRYQKFASDLSGTDIAAHGNDPALAIRAVRNFLSTHFDGLPTDDVITLLYGEFEKNLPEQARRAKQTVGNMTYVDRLREVEKFVRRAGSES